MQKKKGKKKLQKTQQNKKKIKIKIKKWKDITYVAAQSKLNRLNSIGSHFHQRSVSLMNTRAINMSDPFATLSPNFKASLVALSPKTTEEIENSLLRENNDNNNNDSQTNENNNETEDCSIM